MVSHVPFSLDLNTFLKDKRMSISQFILCVLTFFMRFRLPVQNAFPNSCQHSTTELGQKGYLSMIFQMLFKKNIFFGYYRTIWYTYQKEEPYYIVLVTRLLPNTHCGDSYVSVRLQLFQERLSEKVHATIPKGIVGGFEFTVFQRSLKEWHERPWTYVCEC